MTTTSPHHDKLRTIVQSLLRSDASAFDPEVRLADMGMDSLDFADLIVSIEDEFGVSIDEEQPPWNSPETITVGQVLEWIDREVGE